jgi:hypothetical protein
MDRAAILACPIMVVGVAMYAAPPNQVSEETPAASCSPRRGKVGLERRTTRGSNREVVDHGPTTRDDRINAIAGVLVHCADVSGKVTWSTDDPNWHLYLQAVDAGLSANEIAPQAAPITPPAAASFNQGAGALTELQQATDARREHSSHLSDPGPLSMAKS